MGIFVKTEAEKQKQLDKQLSEAVEDMSYYNSQSKNEKILKKIQDLLDEGADVNSTLIPTSPLALSLRNTTTRDDTECKAFLLLLKKIKNIDLSVNEHGPLYLV